NYNMAHGWFLTSAPLKTANWLAAPRQQWTVPIGGGFGRIFRLGDQPVSADISAYYNVAPGTADWQLRATLALLFPEK
ncbi:MAG: porin family protein, partial [Xanthobacteraceae bacterium]